MVGDAGVHVLDPERCRALLDAGRVGRLAFCDGDRPVVLPVNYVTVDRDIYIRTGTGAKAASAARGSTVAFQVDDTAPAEGAPWSVLVTGTSSLVPEDELPDALALDLTPDAGTFRRELFIRVVPEEVTGRRLDGLTARDA